MVTQNTLRTYQEKLFFFTNFRFATAGDLNKCLEHIKLPISLRKPIYDLPSSISTIEICKVSNSYKIRINLLYIHIF